MESLEHLFRREAGRMVATLTRIFGVQNLSLAEDVVQDAFCRALEVWQLRGVPENPSAWLMTTATAIAQRMKRIMGTGTPNRMPFPKNEIAGGNPPMTPPLVA